MSRRTIKVLVPLSTFVAGVLAQLLLQKLTGDLVSTSMRILVAAIGGMAFLLALLTVVISFDYLDRVQQINTISKSIDGLMAEFGLSVEFVPDEPGPHDGMSYERIRQLVAKAERSIVFVDFWAEGSIHRVGQENVRTRRAAYYDEIVKQIERRIHNHGDGPPFHRRIVQVSRLLSPNSRLSLQGDDYFLEYISECLRLQEQSPRTTVIKICRAQVYLHFAVIDDRYVIMPILTAGQGQTLVKRHGALIFEDHAGHLVRELMHIYGMLDAAAQPLRQQQIHLSEA